MTTEHLVEILLAILNLAALGALGVGAKRAAVFVGSILDLLERREGAHETERHRLVSRLQTPELAGQIALAGPQAVQPTGPLFVAPDDDEGFRAAKLAQG